MDGVDREKSIDEDVKHNARKGTLFHYKKFWLGWIGLGSGSGVQAESVG
jgi:hypothetical protein